MSSTNLFDSLTLRFFFSDKSPQFCPFSFGIVLKTTEFLRFLLFVLFSLFLELDKTWELFLVPRVRFFFWELDGKKRPDVLENVFGFLLELRCSLMFWKMLTVSLICWVNFSLLKWFKRKKKNYDWITYCLNNFSDWWCLWNFC